MSNRLNNMAACLAGCILAALFGLLTLLKFDAPFVALISAGAFPAFACWMSGIKNNKQLCKVGVYGTIGWMLAYMLQPVISQSSVSRAARIAELPLLGHEWHIFASFVSTLLALTATCFIPVGDTVRGNDEAEPDSAA